MSEKKVHNINSAKTNTSQTRQKKKALSLDDVARHAEALIRFDQKSALASQNQLNDLVAPSNDSRDGSTTSVSSLEILCGDNKAVKFNKNDAQENIVAFSTKGKQKS
jgi:hypothetical protein